MFILKRNHQRSFLNWFRTLTAFCNMYFVLELMFFANPIRYEMQLVKNTEKTIIMFSFKRKLFTWKFVSAIVIMKKLS